MRARCCVAPPTLASMTGEAGEFAVASRSTPKLSARRKTFTIESRSAKTLDAADVSETIAVVLGTRPGIVKLSPVIWELQKRQLPFVLIHTGQHYSHDIDRQFFRELDLPEPKHQVAPSPSRRTAWGADRKNACGN